MKQFLGLSANAIANRSMKVLLSQEIKSHKYEMIYNSKDQHKATHVDSRWQHQSIKPGLSRPWEALTCKCAEPQSRWLKDNVYQRTWALEIVT